MKSLLLIPFIFCFYLSNATTYYFSNSGSDINNGTSASPWQTLNKFNSVFSSLKPGDNVLFRRGEVFYGSMIISKSGSSGMPITIGAYGSGENPVISGFTNVTTWTNLGSNIWESTSSVSALSSCNMVLINGVNIAMGRYPNSGYLTYQSFSGGSSITSSSLTGSPNWAGAQLVIRKNNYVTDRCNINSQSGGTLNYTSTDGYNGANGYGFYIQNDARTLDTQNEWFYNPSTKKIRIYSTSMPTSVQASTKDTLVTIIGLRSDITFDGLTFSGANQDAFTVRSAQNITIQNCTIRYSGKDAIWGGQNGGANSTNFVVQNNTFSNTNNNAIILESEFVGALISSNSIYNTGMNDGMGGDGSGNYGTLIGVQMYANNGIVQNNTITNVGYNGIAFRMSNIKVNGNVVDSTCIIKQDGAGIYSYVGDGSRPYSGQKVYNNIVLHCLGSNVGTSNTGAPLGHGIYMDDGVANVEIYNNTSASNGYSGLYLHNNYNINVHDNTFYDCGDMQLLAVSFESAYPMRLLNLKGNYFIAKMAAQRAACFETSIDDIKSFGAQSAIDSNYWARPIDDNLTFQTAINSYATITQRNLGTWQTYSGFDTHSGKSNKSITQVSDFRFEYNATSSAKTVQLDANYTDVKNTSYNGEIVLAPYTSAVLIRNGDSLNQIPIADADSDQIITLPINSVLLKGTGTDKDGSIISYKWAKVSGPVAGIIKDSLSASTSVDGLVQGVYKFKLEVTDNAGAIGRDTMQITVNAANKLPVANAGQDQVITLPVNTLTLSGSGNDSDGTVVSYKWTKISGPSSYSITNSTSQATPLTNLIQGTYQFELKVTDNVGAIGRDTMQITVNAANKLPVANAGQDQVITLPVNTLTLSGSGNDSDGTISGYNWTKISGPSSYSITNSTSPATSLTNLVQGTYQFELKVTDNVGAIGRDTMQITVNAAANKLPAANAGKSKQIQLPMNSVTLSGSGNDPDGTVVSYNWTKISGPSNYNISNAGSAATDITGLEQGVYQFQLAVTDNDGATATDAVSITVTAAANISPIANAGVDQTITLPVNMISLTGSGNDPDGTIISYKWTKISGPSNYNISKADSAATDVAGLEQGVYQFQLEVTDNNGAKGRGVLQVTVNAADNISPIADAGIDQTITLPVNMISLKGSGNDSDGTIISYKWTKISGPSNYNISNADSAATDVAGLEQGIYQFKFEVTDNNGAKGLDEVQITVNAGDNISPIADAGIDQTIKLPVNMISLKGSGNDPDGSIVSYKWVKISGPSNSNISKSDSASTIVTGLVQGVYQFQLEVTDNNGAKGLDEVQITVNAADNISPIADAGIDQTIKLPVDTISLTGSGNDPDGSIVSYEWTKVSGPSVYNITDAASPVTTITGLSEGVYQFQLVVTDNNGAIGTDIVGITVNRAENIPPIANAGSDQTITLPVNSLTLSGSGNDPDGTIVSFKWTKISGPSSYNIVDTTLPVTDITGLTEGMYQFQLEVTDDNGATSADTIMITVNATSNLAPNVNAGPDQVITLPTNSLTLSGSGSDADGTVVSYKWAKISGPSSFNIINASLPGTNVTNLLQGIYQFELKVADDKGAIAADTIEVTVNAADNISPVANAGPDKIITLPTNSVNLSGSGTDADGTVVSYLWTKISGPSNYNISNANSAVTNITNLVQGVYQFQLEVADDKGATADDILKVTVNAAPNQSPSASAGGDQVITLPVNVVTLSGSGNDPDGTIVNYTWTKISGPSGYSIANPSSPKTDITNLIKGVYEFQLKVTDNNGATATDFVNITVNAAPNQPPVAKAGSDQTITLPVNAVSVAGSGSDVDGTVVSYTWTKVSGPSAYNIVNPGSPVTDIYGLVEGVYQFRLTVTDNKGAVGANTIKVTVNAAPNQPPVANAGSGQVITLPVDSVVLIGSGSDIDGTVVSYNWTKISGPSSYTIINSSSSTTGIKNLVQGAYQFQLEVSDNKGAKGTDIIKITVNAVPNQPPVSNAGPDKIITLPINSIMLYGSGNDSDGTIAAYTWTKISGPSSYSIVNPGSAVTNITSLVQGVYQFQLQVTDNDGATGTDIVQVTVNAAPNQPPVANAGPDKTITMPVSSLLIPGSGSDIDGTIVSYNWTKISGPVSYTIANSNSSSANITNLVQGVYQFQLKVTDNDGATGTDIVQVTVNAAPNLPPVAMAGQDQTITLPVNSVVLSGNGADPDGTIVAYNWTKISGPSSFTILNPASAASKIENLIAGIYQFELRVTDNNGARGRDTIQITVKAAPNQPPVANAGAGQAITLPVNTVSLSGSGSDADGSVVSYIWKKVSGPSSYNIVNANSPVTDVWGLTEGVYKFQLKVIDNNGATGADTMQIVVNAANIPPVANAGPDQTITLPTNSITLTGNGTDPDGTISSYKWTKISGPAVGKIIKVDLSATSVTELAQGTYLFELKVIDNSGATGRDTMQLIVNAPQNIAPVANAGLDQTIALPINTVSLNGSGTDADGTIEKYFWRQLSGPVVSGVVSPDSARTLSNMLEAGNYEFELTVTDDKGATGRDTVVIVVGAPRLNVSPQTNDIKIYPNPVIDVATLEINTAQANSKLLVVVTDMQGRVVLKYEIIPAQNNTKNKIDMTNLGKGTYAITVYFNEKDKQIMKVIRL